jgi:flagellar hook-length control protein FliK
MAPVAKMTNAKNENGIDAKALAVGHANEAKENANNTLTQEALTAASETQQAANDPNPPRQNEAAAQTSRDVAASQTLPATSLLERIDQARLTNRVAGAFRSLANQSGTIRMKLHPEELGAMTIRMRIESGKVTAKLETETETARQVLLENMDTLKKKLKEQNLEVAAFDIEVTPGETAETNTSDRNAGNRTTRKQVETTETPAPDRKNKGQIESHRENDHVDLYS